MPVGWIFTSTRRARALLATARAGFALIEWIATVQPMHGMDAGPGTGLGGFSILLEKVLPAGSTSTRALGVALVAPGLSTASVPSTVPGLTQPGTKTLKRMVQR